MSTPLFGLACCQKKPAYFQAILAVVPVCGFGTFSGLSIYNSLSWWNPISIGGADYTGLVFNDIWPNVFLQLDESITSAGPAGTSTRRTVYSQDTDTFITQTLDDGAGQFNQNGWQSPGDATVVVSPDGTQLSITWIASGAPVVYTAAVSNPLNAASSWAAWTTLANGLISEFQSTDFGGAGQFPALTDTTWQVPLLGQPFPGSCFGWFIFPQSTTPFFADPGAAFGGFSNLAMGAANGAAVRISQAFATLQGWTNAPSNTMNATYLPDTPVANAWEQDEPAPGSIVGTAVVPNAGYVLSATSRWQLLGLPTNYPVLADDNTNHLAGAWAQPMIIPPGGAPYFENYFSQFRGTSAPVNNLVITPSDVVNTLARTNLGPYGIIGFRLPLPPQGGAGGTGPGAGGGAPAL